MTWSRRKRNHPMIRRMNCLPIRSLKTHCPNRFRSRYLTHFHYLIRFRSPIHFHCRIHFHFPIHSPNLLR
jgi:hypothetical protein